MQLTLHATRPTPQGASRLVQVMSVWSVKTRRAPPRHCRDVRVYGQYIRLRPCMIMSTPPSPSPPSCKSWTHKYTLAIDTRTRTNHGHNTPVDGTHATHVFLQVGDDSSSESSSLMHGAGGKDPKEVDWAKCFSSVHQNLTNVMYFA